MVAVVAVASENGHNDAGGAARAGCGVRAGAKADHDLMYLVGKDKSSEGPWFIVSDDAEVRDACTRQGAFILSNEAFVRLLAGRGLRG